MSGKPIGAMVGLTINYWDGDHPSPGDVLRTPSGRSYLVRLVEYKRNGDIKRISALVVEPFTDPATGHVLYGLEWSSRKRKTRQNSPQHFPGQ